MKRNPIQARPDEVSYVLCVCTGPGLELPAFTFAIFVKSEIGERLIRDEFLLLWVPGGEIEIGVPGAGVEIDLVMHLEGFAI